MTTTPTPRLSLLTPSGHLTLGNLLGALRPMARSQQQEGVCLYGVADLQAMTTAHDPTRLAALTRETQTLMLAAGLDPGRTVLFRQSRVPTHTAAAYLLECTAHVGATHAGEPGTVEDAFASGEESCIAETTPVLEAARAAMGL